MQGEWFDVSSCLIAFCKRSKVDEDSIEKFQATLVRLVSLLNGCILMDLSTGFAADEQPADRAFELELIDAEALDEESLTTFYEANQKVELIFQWIQGLVVEACNDHLFSVAPPIVSRVFQELADGMVHYHQALKIAKMPLPFPYVQSMELLLVLHWIITPPLMCMWVTSPLWTGILTFVQVFFLWSLNTIATELENPFGDDVNDLPAEELQKDLNRRLMMLIEPASQRTPHLRVASEEEASPPGSQPSLNRKLSRTALCRSGFFSSSGIMETSEGSEHLGVRQRVSSSPFASGNTETSLGSCRPPLVVGPPATGRTEGLGQLHSLSTASALMAADPSQATVALQVRSPASDSSAEEHSNVEGWVPELQLSSDGNHKRVGSKGGLRHRDFGNCEGLAELILICRELRDHFKASSGEPPHVDSSSCAGPAVSAQRSTRSRSNGIRTNLRTSTLGSAAEAAEAAAAAARQTSRDSLSSSGDEQASRNL